MRVAHFRLFLFTLAPLAFCGHLGGQILQLDRLKAHYLVNFADFVRWNGQTKNDGVTIGVFNDDDLEWELRKLTNEMSDGRAINVIGINGTGKAQLENIDILFAGAGRAKAWRSLKEHCNGLNILLVGEDRNFLKNGGAIQFTFRKNRLRFYADQANANSLGIQLSSKLLELAAEQPK